jgi:hypothetical protein
LHAGDCVTNSQTTIRQTEQDKTNKSGIPLSLSAHHPTQIMWHDRP